jgi:excisionase family DNA binding protein
MVEVTISLRVLGEKPCPRCHRQAEAPLLMKMGAAARYLGVNRGTLWRMIRDGRLKPVEIMPGSFRVSRRDIERFVSRAGAPPPN